MVVGWDHSLVVRRLLILPYFGANTFPSFPYLRAGSPQLPVQIRIARYLATHLPSRCGWVVSLGFCLPPQPMPSLAGYSARNTVCVCVCLFDKLVPSHWEVGGLHSVPAHDSPLAVALPSCRLLWLQKQNRESQCKEGSYSGE
jgi:hypothetical protein